APARLALANAGYSRLAQLVNASAKELREWHGRGPKAFEVLGRRLAEKGRGVGSPNADFLPQNVENPSTASTWR
ncbi:MAG: hypothetical protein ACRDWB_02905, partial [Acidimicrobiales bacterium]